LPRTAGQQTATASNVRAARPIRVQALCAAPPRAYTLLVAQRL
jgi:hypothetical protein